MKSDTCSNSNRVRQRSKVKGVIKDNMGWSGWEKFGNLTTYEYEQTKYASSAISGGFFIEETHAPSPSDSPLYHVGCSKGPQSAHFPQSAKRPITRKNKQGRELRAPARAALRSHGPRPDSAR